MSEVVLETRGLTIRFGGLTALNDLNLVLHQGELMGLIGPNGAGKTTGFNLITGSFGPTRGTIRFLGNDITGLKPSAVNRLGIARTFQNVRLFKEMTVLENVMLARHGRIRSSFLAAALRLPRYRREDGEMRDHACTLLERLGLREYVHRQAGALAYGPQRKLEMARALATSPSLLLLDEPAAGMNPQETRELMDFILAVRRDFNLSVLLIEHDMRVIMTISDTILVLDHGETIARGKPAEIQKNPDVIRAYLGEKLGSRATKP